MNKQSDLQQYDHLLQTKDWLKERQQPVAITLLEILEPIGGKESVIFPPTFAIKEEAARKRGGHPYPISSLIKSADGADVPAMSAEDAQKNGIEANVCDLDTYGSQSNRMEPDFKKAPLSSLVPQIVIKAVKSRINLLDAGHRVADGAARFSGGFGERAAAAITSLAEAGDASTLAKLAPTSLVFGFWDSRGSQFKAPRILSSTIRATNVAVLKRSAQYTPSFDVVELAQLGELGTDVAEAKESERQGSGDNKNPLSQQGLLAAPATDTHGGVRVFGNITRRTEINLVALRSLTAKKDKDVDEEESLKLRRYLLGLALVAGRSQASYNLRQGCSLVLKEKEPLQPKVVLPTGKRDNFDWEFEAALAFAKAAAEDFGVYVEKPVEEESQFQTAKVVAAMKADELKREAKKAEKAAKDRAKAETKASKDAKKAAEGESKPA